MTVHGNGSSVALQRRARDPGLPDKKQTAERYEISTGSANRDMQYSDEQPIRPADSDAGILHGRIAAIRDSAEVGLLTISRDGRIEDWNTAATRIFGYQPSEAAGRPLAMLFPDDRSDEVGGILDGTFEKGEISTFEGVHFRKDGSRIDVSLTTSPILDSAGEIVAGHVIVRDVSRQKQAEARLAAEHAVTRILSRSRSLDEAAPLLLEAITICLRCDIGELWQPDPREPILRLGKHVILDRGPELERFARESEECAFIAGLGLPGRVWSTKQPSWIAELPRDTGSPRARTGLECGLRSGAAFPILRSGGEVLGVMTFFSSVRMEPDLGLLDMMEAVALEIGQFVAHREIEDERQHLAAIVENSQDAIIGWDLDGRVTSWNRGAQQMYGYTAEAALGRSMLMLVPSELHRTWWEHFAIIKTGRSFEQHETVRITKDGARLDVSLTVSPIKNERGGVVGVATIARDITQMKRAKELRELLVSELNHRLKNILSIVQALAMQNTSVSVDEFRKAFNDRLVSLAEIYELITGSNWQPVDLREIVSTVLRPYEHEITVLGEEVTFAPDESITLGIVLHELTTNAVKYGALSVTGGRIDVSWKMTDSEHGRALEFAWTESGGPTVGQPNQRGAGLELIEHSIPHQFDGKAVVDYAEEGIRWRITIPRPQ